MSNPGFAIFLSESTFFGSSLTPSLGLKLPRKMTVSQQAATNFDTTLSSIKRDYNRNFFRSIYTKLVSESTIPAEDFLDATSAPYTSIYNVEADLTSYLRILNASVSKTGLYLLLLHVRVLDFHLVSFLHQNSERYLSHGSIRTRIESQCCQLWR